MRFIRFRSSRIPFSLSRARERYSNPEEKALNSMPYSLHTLTIA